MSTELRPTIVVDTREQEPLPIATYPTLRAGLLSGDYSVAGLEAMFSVERKSIPDLVQSLTRDRARFVRELERLRGYRFARLLIIGCLGQLEQGQYRSRVTPKALVHSLWSIEAKYVPVVFAPTPQAGAELVERWAFWFARSIAEAARGLQASQGRPLPETEEHREISPAPRGPRGVIKRGAAGGKGDRRPTPTAFHHSA